MFYSLLLPVSHFFYSACHAKLASECRIRAGGRCIDENQTADGAGRWQREARSSCSKSFLLNHAAGGEFICSLPHRDPSPWPLSWSSCVPITAAKWLKSTLMGNVLRSYWENCLFLLYTMIYCLTVNCRMSCHPLQSVLKTLVWWMSIIHVLKPKDTQYKGLQFSLTSGFICDQDEWCVLL